MKRLAEGIYELSPGVLRVQVKGGHGPDTVRIMRAPLKEIDAKRWQRRRLAEIADEKRKAAPKPARTGSLKADIPAFLAQLPESPRKKALDALLDIWARTPLGRAHRADITKAHVREQLATWGSSGGRTGAGYSASEINKRLAALRQLYRALDGDDGPTAGIRKLREPEPEPRGVPFEVALEILDAMPTRRRERVLSSNDAKAIFEQASVPHSNKSAIARAYGISETMVRKIAKRPDQLETWDEAAKAVIRLRVILFTGFPHAQVMKIKPEHIDWTGGTILTTPRRKGAGAKPRRLPLLPEAIDALKDFDVAGCYGTFATSPVRRAWVRARDAVAAGITDPQVKALIATLRPYDLRHSFGTEVYRQSGDERATGELLLHAPGSKLTARYTLAAVSETAQRAISAVQQRRAAVLHQMSKESAT